MDWDGRDVQIGLGGVVMCRRHFDGFFNSRDTVNLYRLDESASFSYRYLFFYTVLYCSEGRYDYMKFGKGGGWKM